MVLQVYLDDIVALDKPHACGGSEWVVVRLGADIGLRCLRCRHRVLLPRGRFEQRFARFIKRAVPPEPEIDLDLEQPQPQGRA
jgi:hypothetical protein